MYLKQMDILSIYIPLSKQIYDVPTETAVKVNKLLANPHTIRSSDDTFSGTLQASGNSEQERTSFDMRTYIFFTFHHTNSVHTVFSC